MKYHLYTMIYTKIHHNKPQYSRILCDIPKYIMIYTILYHNILSYIKVNYSLST